MKTKNGNTQINETNKNTPSRSWVYTLNDYSPEELLQLQLFTAKRHRAAKEVGESGTPHIQGAVTFIRAYRLSQLKKLLPRAHWEPAKVSDPENYCTKGEVIIDLGHNLQGRRTDLETVCDELESGAILGDIARKHPGSYIRYHAGMEKLAFIVQNTVKTFYPIEVIIIWGPPGIGKSLKAREIDEELYNVQHPQNGKLWFDGYYGQETILFDDFYGSWFPYSMLLQYTDVYPFIVQTKGGQTRRKWKRIIFTSNKRWEEWYPSIEDGTIESFRRRITKVIDLNPPECRI